MSSLRTVILGVVIKRMTDPHALVWCKEKTTGTVQVTVNVNLGCDETFRKSSLSTTS